MGSWDSVLFERRVLSWVVGLAVAGVLLWVLAVATPYWTIQIYPHDPRLLWGYTGLLQSCILVEESFNASGSSLFWECQANLYHNNSNISAVSRSEISLAAVSGVLSLASLGFSIYSIHHPKYVYKRLTSVLYVLYSACILIVLQLTSNHEQHKDTKVLYGWSYLLGCSACIAGAASGATFLVYSRKTKLLKSENLEYNPYKLTIQPSIPTRST